MYSLQTSRRMKTVANFFIANLAIADIIIGIFTIPFQFQAALLQRWDLPHFLCAFCPFIQVFLVCCTVLNEKFGLTKAIFLFFAGSERNG